VDCKQSRRRLLVSLSLGGVLAMIKSLIKLILGITLLLAVIVFGPLLGIWSLNILFPVLNIPYTWETWAAYFLVFGSLTGLRIGSRRKE
jgi:hypothetical protein